MAQKKNLKKVLVIIFNCSEDKLTQAISHETSCCKLALSQFATNKITNLDGNIHQKYFPIYITAMIQPI
jgi:hypothetical protein